MFAPASRRGGFTRMELIVTAIVLAVLLAILIPMIRQAIAAARQTSCSCHLKQIGLGIQNYHDVRREICPAYLTDDHGPRAQPRDFATWPFLLLPYIEQTNVYQLVDVARPLSSDAANPGFTSAATARATMIYCYFCPGRRSPMLTVNSVAAVGDYGSVSRADLLPLDPLAPRTWDAAMLPSRAFNTSQEGMVIDGIALDPGEFRSMTTFADIIDGLSNTVFAGEKAVRADAMGGHPTVFSKTIDADQQDGTFYYGGLGVTNNMADLKTPGAIAYWSRRLAPNGNNPTLPPKPLTDPPENRFGSWHEGVTCFMLGDGSVRVINNSTSSRVLQQFGCRNDQGVQRVE